MLLCEAMHYNQHKTIFCITLFLIITEISFIYHNNFLIYNKTFNVIPTCEVCGKNLCHFHAPWLFYDPLKLINKTIKETINFACIMFHCSPPMPSFLWNALLNVSFLALFLNSVPDMMCLFTCTVVIQEDTLVLIWAHYKHPPFMFWYLYETQDSMVHD